MNETFRVLLLTGVATGIFAAALSALQPPPPPRPTPTGTLEIDAERMAEADRDALLQELSEQL